MFPIIRPDPAATETKHRRATIGAIKRAFMAAFLPDHTLKIKVVLDHPHPASRSRYTYDKIVGTTSMISHGNVITFSGAQSLKTISAGLL
jgi:hypothetical protein